MRFTGIRTIGSAVAFVLALTLPAVGHCDATSINGTCVYGNCTTPDSISNSSTSSSTSNVIDVGGSPFLVTTSFNASESGAGVSWGFGYQVTYIGATPLPSAETVSIAFLQGFYDPDAVDWDGTYSSNDSQNLDDGTSFTSTLELDGQVAVSLGPFDGPGLQGGSGSALVTGLDGSTLNFEQIDNVTFNAGDPFDTTVGDSATPPSLTPEPSSLLLLATGLGVPASFLRRRLSRAR
jgi:hypothetical protein